MMKNPYINIYTLLNRQKFWKNYEYKKLILHYLLKTKLITKNQQILVKLIRWDLKKKHFISKQINVCKKSGNFKRTFNQIGFNRHVLRFHLNENQIIHLKKLSW